MSEFSLQDVPTNDEEQFLVLAMRCLDGLASAEEEKTLTDQLRSDAVRRRWFVTLCRQSGMLREVFSAGGGRGTWDVERGTAGPPAIEEESGFRGQGSEIANPKSQIPNQQIFSPESPFPPIVFDHFPPSSSPLPLGSWTFSYLVAMVVVGLMLLGAWAYKITHYQQIAEAPSAPSSEMPKMEFVGRITGMKDCRWSDPSTEAYTGAAVPLDRRYALASGLMQISYDSGAKVILQGPCTYEVESDSGGYLSLGKLTTRIEGRREKREESAKPQSANLHISNPQSLIPNPFFAVRTPTAVVTDLGTEFGVEVGEEGNTTSHVFRGSVKVQVVGESLPSPAGRGAGGEGRVVQLGAGESARVEKGKDNGEARIVTGGEVGDAPKFVRRLVEPPKMLDLLDIVAGGNGTGHRREHGIDPVTGRVDWRMIGRRRVGDGRYWPVAWQRLIDGAFVPDGRAGAVRLDSAGHRFDEFPATSGRTWGPIWARGADVKPGGHEAADWIYVMGRGEQFMPDRRGLLGLHANAGLTFDLGAVRKMYRGARPARFRATAGLADARDTAAGAGMADLWIFVDGRLKLKREKLRPQDGAFNVDVELGPNDRFLTLAATDGGNGITSDWVVFGDPVVQMTTTEPEN